MPHDTPLILTLVSGLTLAFAFGMLAHRLRMPPLVGYLAAGIAVGPATPGIVADLSIAGELAEIGVVLLMFGVGLHFSLGDLRAVRRIAVPGAVGQIAFATVLGAGLATWLGWSVTAAVIFGLALSVASTVVLLRALEERDWLDTPRGKIAVGWLIVEDLAMVLALVLLPAFAVEESGALDPQVLATSIGITLLKVCAFVAVMLLVGRRVIPAILERVAAVGSRELFTLSVLAIALGVAFGAYKLFGVSFALGAFFAGMMLNESRLSHEAAQDSLPMRDAFSVLFFVSVGMLFNPAILVEQPLAVFAAFLIIVVGKSLAAYAIVRLFGHARATALTIAVSLAQIGEFSFILAGLGVGLGLLPEAGRDLILAGALLSIILNPVLFNLLAARAERIERAVEPQLASNRVPVPEADHVVIVGYGRVGSHAAHVLQKANVGVVVIETEAHRVEAARALGIPSVLGNGVSPRSLAQANVAKARTILVAIPQALAAGEAVAALREQLPDACIVSRSHSDADTRHLLTHGADAAVTAEREVAETMADMAIAAVRKRPVVPAPGRFESR